MDHTVFHLMRSIILFLLLLALGGIALADSIPTFSFKEPLKNKYVASNFYDILEDTAHALSLDSILTSPEIQAQFSRNDYRGAPTVIWLRARMENKTGQALYYRLGLPAGDSLIVYEISKEGIQPYLVGRAVSPEANTAGLGNNSLHLYLASGESKTYYIRSVLCDCYRKGGFNRLLLVNPEYHLQKAYFGMFFTAVIIVILLISILLFLLFRDKIYLAMGLPLLGIVLYFGTADGLVYDLFPIVIRFAVYLNTITAWLLITCFTIYTVFYLGLHIRLKRVFLTISILLAIHTVVSALNIMLPVNFIIYTNSLTLLLILIMSGTGIYLAIKKDGHARIWLLFVTPIAIAGFLHTLVLMKVISIPVDSYLIFKTSALFATGIIGYSLYERVNATIRENIRAIRENERLVREQNIILERKVEQRTQELEKEKEKSESILLNILPQEVAEELKETGGSEARLFENVTVLFTDFVDFTKAGERMTAKELVNELHTCFKGFDEIIQQHNIEKVKTVGDAYIAVAGLPITQADHAVRLTRAALDIREFMADRWQHHRDNTFRIRLGIHSGHVVAGIVGVKKFAYDIWGDTVNTAARMEQCSEAGQINVSQATYELIQEEFACTYRGKIPAKNKGNQKMYFVERAMEKVP